MKSVKMPNVAKSSQSEGQKLEKVSAERDYGKPSSTPQSSGSSPRKSDENNYLAMQNFMPTTSSSESDEEEVSEVSPFVIDNPEFDEVSKTSEKFLARKASLPEDSDHLDRTVDPETQARLEALLEAAGISKLSSTDGKALADPEVLRRLTSSVSCALDEAAAALTRMRNDNPRAPQQETRSLVEACSDGDVGTVRKLLSEGRSVHETTEDGESLLSLACSAGYFELAQVLLAMSAGVEDRGIKGDCTPLMEAASAGHADIVRLLIENGADVNAQSSTGNTPLMYACAGGHLEVVEILLAAGANVEDHNENGHTPLMEAASAGYVNVAKVLLENGAGINTHSNEFKESALTLACYKGHLEMVRFLLAAGADQEHKTDEMHTALMEASMDGHVEVARLLLDSGAQVNMPTDSFESPLTLAACGGHVDLALLLIERGANIEEVNDEGYTPLMEAAREGHEEMVALLLSQGANINAQTEETQETALTLACCGGFLEVAEFLIKAGADIEAGASTPLMEASQEGHLDLVRYLLSVGANVNATTSTGDTALTYACENGHTDVAELLLQNGADLEHESEGGRTPLMKACRAGHLCTVQFLVSKNADVNRQTTNNDHTPLSLACAGGHQSVVEFLLANQADPFHKLKDNSTMLIEAAKGGHTHVVQLLLDYPNNVMIQQQVATAAAAAAAAAPLPPGSHSNASTQPPSPAPTPTATQTTPGLHEAPDGVRTAVPPHEEIAPTPSASTTSAKVAASAAPAPSQGKSAVQKSLIRKFRPSINLEGSPAYTQDVEKRLMSMAETDFLAKGIDPGLLSQKSITQLKDLETKLKLEEEKILQKKILEELQRVEEELQVTSPHILLGEPVPPAQLAAELPPSGAPSSSGSSSSASPPATKVKVLDIPLDDISKGLTNITLPPASDITFSSLPPNFFSPLCTATLPASFYGSPASKVPPHLGQSLSALSQQGIDLGAMANQTGFTLASMPSLSFQAPTAVTSASTTSIQNAPVPTAAQILGDVPTSFHAVTPPDSTTLGFNVAAPTPIQDRPKAKPVSKKDAKNRISKQQLAALQLQQIQQLNQQLQAHVANQAGPPVSEVAGADVAKVSSEMAQAKSLLQQTAHTQQTLQQLHQLQNQLKQLEEAGIAGIGGASQSQIHQMLQKQLKALQQQAPITRVQDKSSQAVKEDSGGETKDGKEQTVEETYPESLEKTADLLAALKLHVDEKALETQLTYQRAVEEAINLSLLTPQPLAQTQQQQQQQPGSQPLNIQFPAPPALDADAATRNAAFQRLEYIPVKMQLKPTNEIIVPGTNIHLSYQLPMNQAAVSLPANAFVQTPVQPDESNLFASGSGPPGQAQLQAISSRLAQASASLGGLKPHKIPMLPPQIAPQTPEGGATPTSVPSSGSRSSSTSSGSGSDVKQAVTTPSSVAATVSASTQSTTSIAPSVTQAATQTPNKKKGNKKSPYLPAGTQPARPTTSTAAVATLQQPAVAHQQQQHTHHHHHHHQQPVDDDKTLLPPHQNIMQNYQYDATTGVPIYQNGVAPYTPQQFHGIDVDSETDSNHDTALTLGCAGGHEDLVELLISRGANIEHRDKKGFTPLILAATAGHEKVVKILLDHQADIEAQSERTKDTPLSLACSGGRIEVVSLLLSRNANKEHRNVSDYTPLSLAASGGYVNIIKLLLNAGAEINSRTGSKLGISPLMLAAMNGHTAAVKLLLDMGSDINAQIETNRNTALTLACFQGRHEVVSLLLDRKANVEHRAKTGLTPLMEAASGGYVEVGRVLLDKGADVNAPPVPSSRDTALTIAADKGHVRFVELLLNRGAQVEVKNKKGNSPLWLAANGGHLNVIEMLYNHGADIDSQDNRKVSCLMAAFRKGHVKAVKWMVHRVTQFPSDQEMSRYISTITLNEKELLDKCVECVQEIRAAKDMQAAKASMNADNLLEELDQEKTREESKKAAAARRRERKKKKKLEKKEEKRKVGGDENDDDKESGDEDDKDQDEPQETVETKVDVPPESPAVVAPRNEVMVDKEEGDSGIDANSQGSCSSNDVKSKEKRKEKKKKNKGPVVTTAATAKSDKENSPVPVLEKEAPKSKQPAPAPLPTSKDIKPPAAMSQPVEKSAPTPVLQGNSQTPMTETNNISNKRGSNKVNKIPHLMFEATPKPQQHQHPAEREDFEATGNETYVPSSKSKKSSAYLSTTIQYCDSEPAPVTKSSTSPKQGGKREEGWKEVVRKYVNSPFKSKKVLVPSNAISRVIGRGGSNINAIRTATGAHIEVDKQTKGQGERTITIKGSSEATKQAHMLISALVKDPEADLTTILPKKGATAASSATSGVTWTAEMTKVAAPTGKSSKSSAAGATAASKPIPLSAAQPNVASKQSIATAQLQKLGWFLEGKVEATPEMLANVLPGASTSALTSLLNSNLRSAVSTKTTTTMASSRSAATAPRHAAAAEKRAAAAAAASNNTKTTMSYTTAIMTAGRATKISTTTTQTFAAKLTESSAPIQGLTTSTTPSQPKQSRGAAAASSTPQSTPVPQSPIKHSAAPTASRASTAGIPSLIDAAPMVKPLMAESVPNGPPAQAQHSQQGRKTPQEQPQQMQPPQQQPIARPSSRTETPLQQYSLFNDSKPVWGCENDAACQKGMNFASVAAAGNASGPGQAIAAPKFLDSLPPQVDASKAPGYRGSSISSPVLPKASISVPQVPSNYQNAPSNFTEPPPPLPTPIGMNTSPNQKQAHPIARPSSHGDIGPPPVSQAETYRQMLNERAEMQRASGHMHMSSSNIIEPPPNQQQQQYTLAPSPGYEHPPPLLKVVQPQSGGQGHHQEAGQQHMMGPYPPTPPQSAGPNMQQHYQSGANANQASAASMSPPSMHSRLNPRAPDFSSSLHGMGGKQQSQQQQSMGSQQQNVQSGGSQPQHQQMSHQMPQMYNMQPNQANANPIILNQFKPNASNSYHRGSGAPPSHHQMPPTRWSIPMTHNMHHQQDLLNYLPQNMPPEILGLENGAQLHHHGSPTNMSPSANNNSPPVDQLAAAQLAKQLEEQRRVPRPIGTERAWKYSMNNASEQDAWLNQNKMVNPSWAGNPPDRLPYMMGRPGGIRLDELDNAYHNQPDGSHSFLNGAAPAMNMMQHGMYMPFVGAGLGPDMGPDMIGKLEAPSWDPTARMGLTELPDKPQGWNNWSK
ncbi:ankyrin repeat domain-containing protein 17 isoform X2 [Neocloeon triangulifer]|uniref:ankyrin repeat domain-containing protein 17 isoform X2 n=1 Tax=Neocloeon triangulifer TaxID=2078957 RepID=UPI00286EC5B4|nr:ankyrin repeat domain-containing protein 17 isoform X2 [Neocloeon triangulifer]